MLTNNAGDCKQGLQKLRVRKRQARLVGKVVAETPCSGIRPIRHRRRPPFCTVQSVHVVWQAEAGVMSGQSLEKKKKE